MSRRSPGRRSSRSRAWRSSPRRATSRPVAAGGRAGRQARPRSSRRSPTRPAGRAAIISRAASCASAKSAVETLRRSALRSPPRIPATVETANRYLHDRLALVAARVAAAVAHRRADDPDPTDRFSGLYISEAQVDGLLAGDPGALLPEPPDDATAGAALELEAWADEAERNGAVLRLRRLARAFELTPLDVELLLIVLAPDLEPRFERLYGYLHDDVSRRRASTGLALELCAGPKVAGNAVRPGIGFGAGRSRLDPGAPLVAGGLVLVEDPERPFLTRSLRVPDRVTAHLLGVDAPDPIVAALLTTAV